MSIAKAIPIFIMLLPALVAAEEFAKASATKIEAAYLRNFAHYVVWPAQSFPDNQAPWRICVLGGDPFGDVLDETCKGRVEQGRALTVARPDSATDAKSCQIVFLAHRSAESRRAALTELSRRAILTVGDAPGFLDDGGIVRFQVSDRVEFAVNVDRANAASLTIPTKVLEVAQEVVENGTVRRRR